jgi:hypothetical protein
MKSRFLRSGVLTSSRSRSPVGGRGHAARGQTVSIVTWLAPPVKRIS